MTQKPYRYDPTHHVTQPFPPCESRDALSATAASQLAKELTAWWHERGHPHARFWVEGSSARGYGHIAVVRSNLVNGLPPSKPDAVQEQPAVVEEKSAEQMWRELAMPRRSAA